MIISNFTCDPISWTHLGANGTIPAYNPEDPKKPHIINFEDSRARFILNKFAVRGLVAMNFGDDEETKKAESLKLWRIFWERQIEAHNQHNEDQKEKGNRYSRPTDELDKHAKLLGLELLRPWRVEAKQDNKQVDELKGENLALRKSLESMQTQMTELMKMMVGRQAEPQKEKPKTRPEPEAEKKAAPKFEPKPDLDPKPGLNVDDAELEKIIAINKNKYLRLGEGNMNLWVSKNWDDILAMPDVNRVEIEEKYEKLYGVPFPQERM